MGPSAEKHPDGAFIPPCEKIEELIERAEPIPILAGINEKEGYMIYGGICSYIYVLIFNLDAYLAKPI